MTALIWSVIAAVWLAGIAACALAMHHGLPSGLPGAAGTPPTPVTRASCRAGMTRRRTIRPRQPAVRLHGWLSAARELLRTDPDAPCFAFPSFGPFDSGHDLAVLLYLASVQAPAETD